MMHTIWSDCLASGARQMTSSAIRNMLHVTEQPAIISFAGGLPAPECFPTAALTAAAERVLVNQTLAALQYGPTEGYRPLRSLVASQMEQLGLAIPASQVLISSGSQQALDLLGKLFLDPQALVAVEEPTYLGALQAWRPYRPRFVALPLDDEGLDVAELSRRLANGLRPRFLYLVSCFQNPTGVTLSPQRRAALIELAAHYRLPIVEDDPYGALHYDGARPQPLAALDSARHGALRHVIYLGTFSKVLAPGLRVGWIAAPADLFPKLVQAKQGLDLHTSGLTQTIIVEACQQGLLEQHLPQLRSTYCTRRDAMLTALAQSMPAGTRWTQPAGGMFIWVTLSAHLNAATLLPAALEQQVAFVPGETFYANGGGMRTLRLNFTHATPEQIATGIARLGQTIVGSASIT